MSVGVDAWLTIASLHKLQVVILQWFISVIVNKNLGAPTPRWRWLKVSLTRVFLFLVSCSKKCFVAFSFPSVFFFFLSLADWWTLSSNNNSVETEICDLTPNHSKKCFLKALFFFNLDPWPVTVKLSTCDIQTEWTGFDTASPSQGALDFLLLQEAELAARG